MKQFGGITGKWFLLLVMGVTPVAWAEETEDAGQGEAATEVDTAREVLKQKETDVTSESALEEVFQAQEDRYSLLKSGEMSLNFSANYSYFRDDRIDISLNPASGSVDRFRIENDSQHSIGTSLSFDYGVWDNLTLNSRVPISYKYDTQKDVSKAALGDVSFGFRYQPFPVRPGAMNATLFGTLSTATGDSPYEIDVNNDVASGKGYYALGGGLSMSKVLDPVVLFGSMGYTLALDATDLNQRRGSRTLEEVQPGDSLSFSFGFAYSLSYEVSLSASYSQSYNFDTKFLFKDPSQGPNAHEIVTSEDSTSSTINMSMGLRSSKNRIVNVSLGYGLTEDAPDVLLGFSMPIDITGLKPSS